MIASLNIKAQIDYKWDLFPQNERKVTQIMINFILFEEWGYLLSKNFSKNQ